MQQPEVEVSAQDLIRTGAAYVEHARIRFAEDQDREDAKLTLQTAQVFATLAVARAILETTNPSAKVQPTGPYL